jgi:hypothetical protein
MMISIGTGEYIVRYPVDSRDELDLYLDDELADYGRVSLDPAMRADVEVEEIIIREHNWRERSDIHLFKTTDDLYDLGYEIVSHRTRINSDSPYRRYNIMQAFHKMGNVLVLNP